MAPANESAAGALEPAFRLNKLNSDHEQEAASRLAIRGIPTMILFTKGREAAPLRLSGIVRLSCRQEMILPGDFGAVSRRSGFGHRNWERPFWRPAGTKAHSSRPKPCNTARRPRSTEGGLASDRGLRPSAQLRSRSSPRGTVLST